MWASKAIADHTFEHFSQACVHTNTAIIIDPSLLQDEVVCHLYPNQSKYTKKLSTCHSVDNMWSLA